MKISWTPPDADGGSPIIRYLLEYTEKASAVWITVNLNEISHTTTVVNGLEEHTEYEFRVYAENEVGLSEVSISSEFYKTLGMF